MSPPLRLALTLLLVCNLSSGASFSQPATTSADPAKPAIKREVIRVNESRTNLLLFPTGEEVFLDALFPGNADVFAAGSAGTVLSIDNNRLVFHTGHLFLNSGKSSLTVGSRLANIRLGSDTTAVLDLHPHKPLHVAVLTGTSPVHVKIRDRRSTIALKAGEEMYISDTTLPADEYKTADPIERENISQENTNKECEGKSLELVRRTFDARKLLAWHVNEINSGEKLGGNKKAFLDKLLPPTNNTTGGVERQDNEPWHVLACGGTEFTLLPSNTGIIHLRSGELFIFTNDYAVVETSLGEVHGDKGSMFAVDTSDGNLRARAMTGPGDITVVTGKHKLPVPPGEEVVISDHQPSKEDTIPKDGVARRNPTTRALDDKLSATVTDFNILSQIVAANYLKPIKKPFWPQEKSALEKLIQTAAAIETVTRAKGGYTGAPREEHRPQRQNPGQAI